MSVGEKNVFVPIIHSRLVFWDGGFVRILSRVLPRPASPRLPLQLLVSRVGWSSSSIDASKL
ncbi:hypothetical protein E2C01_028006 [Portunus trituberculatus]|uniref:Uncharacterized protein n=1 Tax=Portunus trituberculatus TaxID=210409 RepID=A0A5B7EK75_PORTR|nr:hypothetical protein [Portunus trituberculatus]